MDTKPASPGQSGVASWENWQLAARGEPLVYSYEVPLHSDGRIQGQVTEGLGPYRLLNLQPIDDPPGGRPHLVLRVSNHLVWDASKLGPMNKSNVEKYHGGALKDELAALVSLRLGVRLKAGRLVTRWFEPGGDPEGRPTSAGPGEFIPTRQDGRVIVPRARMATSLATALSIETLRDLTRAAAVALVKAARQFQGGLWVAETDPAHAWIRLISAVETAAGFWRQTEYSPREKLVASRRDLEDLLVARGGDELANEVAELIAPYMGATKSFVEFLAEFGRAAPATRPLEWARASFELSDFKSSMSSIYGHRSKALHGGIAMPLPLCEPPYFAAGLGAPAERPIGTATSADGGTWTEKDTPMCLHTFEHVVRSALLAWWESLPRAAR